MCFFLYKPSIDQEVSCPAISLSRSRKSAKQRASPIPSGPAPPEHKPASLFSRSRAIMSTNRLLLRQKATVAREPPPSFDPRASSPAPEVPMRRPAPFSLSRKTEVPNAFSQASVVAPAEKSSRRAFFSTPRSGHRPSWKNSNSNKACPHPSFSGVYIRQEYNRGSRIHPQTQAPMPERSNRSSGRTSKPKSRLSRRYLPPTLSFTQAATGRHVRNHLPTSSGSKREAAHDIRNTNANASQSKPGSKARPPSSSGLLDLFRKIGPYAKGSTWNSKEHEDRSFGRRSRNGWHYGVPEEVESREIRQEISTSLKEWRTREADAESDRFRDRIGDQPEVRPSSGHGWRDGVRLKRQMV